MLWTSVILLVLAVGRVPARSNPVIKADFIENVSKGDSRIVSGWEARPGQHPHHANLRMMNAAGQLASCGASIIHQNWALTAAHCTALRTSVVVRAGMVFINDARYIHETTEWYNYPTYIDAMVLIVQPNDISLIRLHQAIFFNELLKPIRLQSRADAHRNYETAMMYASGHGRTWTGGATTDVLQWVYLRGMSNLNCQRVFGSIITENSVCARYFNVTSQSTCHGDSGGPLVFEDNGVPTLIGVTSFVAGEQSGGCHSGFPAGFIRPGPFHPWFTVVTGIDFENLHLEETTWSPTNTPTINPTETPFTDTTEIVTTPPPTEITSTDPPVSHTTESDTNTPVQTTPWLPQTTPRLPQTTPRLPETTPWLPETTPWLPETTPWLPETTPWLPETTPWLPETTPWLPETTTWIPETTTPEEKPEESEEDSSGEESDDSEEGSEEEDSDEDDDCEPKLSELLKKLEVEVNVKIKMHKKHKINHKKTITHQHKHKLK